MKKRVLQFIGSFHQGGSEQQAVSLTRLLKNEGSFEVFAATLNNSGVLRSEIDAANLPEIPEFPLTSFFSPSFVHQVRKCAGYMRANRIDLVHTHDFYTNVFGIAAATLAGIPGRVASKRETGGMRSAGQEFVEKLAFGRAKAIVANSKSVRDHLTGLGVATDKIKVIYNGINLGRFDTPKADHRLRLGLPTGDNVRFITLVANLRHAVKNVPLLLRSAKRIVEHAPDVHFLIAGEGELKPELEQLAKQLGVAENVHFIGPCTDIPALLSVTYAGVLTSTAEGFSNSILEYMSAGRPVVATNVGGASEAIVDGGSGFLIASNDDSALAERLTELLDDGRKACRFGAEGRRIVVSTFSEEAQLRNTIDLYAAVLK